MEIKNLKNFVSKGQAKITLGATALITSFPVMAHAAGTSVADMMKTSFEQVVTDTLAGITAIAPIGITIFGAMFAWKKGKQFFNKVS